MVCELAVTVLAGSELNNVEKKGKSDPFVVLEFQGVKCV